MKRILPAAAIALALLAFISGAFAADNASVRIVIKDHRFTPSEVVVPAGQRVELMIENHDATPEEFESDDLRREKIVVGKGRISVWVGPLPAGTYSFYGEYNKKIAQGKLIAK
jgi:plastocyanin